MKVIPLSEAKAHLSKYARMCQKQPIVVTVNGRPAFQLVPLAEDDDLIDQLIEGNPDFRRLLMKRLKEPSVSASAAARRL
jgi:prevent-host-death family protein